MHFHSIDIYEIYTGACTSFIDIFLENIASLRLLCDLVSLYLTIWSWFFSWRNKLRKGILLKEEYRVFLYRKKPEIVPGNNLWLRWNFGLHSLCQTNFGLWISSDFKILSFSRKTQFFAKMTFWLQTWFVSTFIW